MAILTTAQAEESILKIYDLYANRDITKPVDLKQLVWIAEFLEDFSLSIVRLQVE